MHKRYLCRIQKSAVEIQKILTLCRGFDILIVLGRSEDCPFFVPEVISLEKNAITYRIVRSSRKTLSLEITARGQVLVRAPRRLSEAAIDRFLRSKEDWIRSRLAKYQSRPVLPALTREELTELKARAGESFADLVSRWASRLGVTWGKITIRAQKSRWGSCSAQGNLKFNCLLMLAPVEVREYVAVHELCHRKHMNHSPAFWAEVEKALPDYEVRRQWLKDNGNALLARLPEKE